VNPALTIMANCAYAVGDPPDREVRIMRAASSAHFFLPPACFLTARLSGQRPLVTGIELDRADCIASRTGRSAFYSHVLHFEKSLRDRSLTARATNNLSGVFGPPARAAPANAVLAAKNDRTEPNFLAPLGKPDPASTRASNDRLVSARGHHRK